MSLRNTVLACGLHFAVATVMPDGREYPEECIHRFTEEHLVVSTSEGGDILTNQRTGERTVLPPCSTTRSSQGRLGYYSSWIVDTVSVHDSIGRMATNWTVPTAPASRGPVPGMSSMYLFNGLEDGGGHSGEATVILQPVLSYGKSGCVLNPLAGWEFTAFQVTAGGRAYCGPKVSVQEGDKLQGVMELVGNETWNIIADAGAKGRSSHTVQFPAGHKFNAAYCTLEGMVVYNCKALPGTGLDFTANQLAAPGGAALVPSWKTEVRHTECQPTAKINGDTVSFNWQNTATVADVVV